jgi:hypothetical protein
MDSDRERFIRQEFPENVQVRGPRGTRAAIWRVARRKHSTPSAVLRQYIIRGLEEDGASIPSEMEATA